MRIHLSEAPGFLPDVAQKAINFPVFDERGASLSFRYTKIPDISVDSAGLIFTDPCDKRAALSIGPEAWFAAIRKAQLFEKERARAAHYIIFDRSAPRRRMFLCAKVWQHIQAAGTGALKRHQARSAKIVSFKTERHHAGPLARYSPVLASTSAS